jgi:hypothetical protein
LIEAENLHRAELTELEWAEHVAEWVRLTEEEVKAQVAPAILTPEGGADRRNRSRAASTQPSAISA